MLIAAESSDVQLVGYGLGGTADVQRLQQNLLALSQVSNWPAANPGPVSGDVSNQTVMAIAAVIGKLASHISSSIASAVQAGVVIAAFNTDAMAAAKTMVGQYAGYLADGVQKLTALYTASGSQPSAPPNPPATTAQKVILANMVPMAMMSKTQKSALPPGTITAYSAMRRAWRVAVPQSAASQLGGPSLSLGEDYHELPAQASQPSGAAVVSEPEFDNKVEPKPFYKKPWFWGAAAAGLGVAGTIAYLLIRR